MVFSQLACMQVIAGVLENPLDNDLVHRHASIQPGSETLIGQNLRLTLQLLEVHSTRTPHPYAAEFDSTEEAYSSQEVQVQA